MEVTVQQWLNRVFSAPGRLCFFFLCVDVFVLRVFFLVVAVIVSS